MTFLSMRPSAKARSKNAAPNFWRNALVKGAACLGLAPLLAGVFLVMLLAVFALPNDPIARNILDRPDKILDRRSDIGRVIDADTECIGASVGLYRDTPAPLLTRAVEAQSVYGCGPLFGWLNDKRAVETRPYFRYWHGHTVLLRPLLSILPYNDVRAYILMTCLALLGALAWLLRRDFGRRTVLAVIAPFIVLNAAGYWLVGTKATTWFLIIGGALYIACRARNQKSADASLGGETPPLVAFFMLGALTAFFDFFTAPALVFFFPLLISYLYQAGTETKGDTKGETKAMWRNAVALGAFFAFGYAGLWSAKWIIAAQTLNAPVWSDILGSARFRLRGASEHVDTFLPGAALYANFTALKAFWGPVAFGLFIVAPLTTRARRARLTALATERPLLLCIALGPLAWLELTSNHAQIHAAFTQLAFAPIFALSALVSLAAPLTRARQG